jgi:cytochrome c
MACNWTNILMNAAMALIAAILACFALPSSGKAQGLSRGKELFEKRCGGCHSLDRDKEGPRLRGVYGRPSAAVSYFNYSTPLKGARIIWDADFLDKWL